LVPRDCEVEILHPDRDVVSKIEVLPAPHSAVD
jgi:hypothetical protein